MIKYTAFLLFFIFILGNSLPALARERTLKEVKQAASIAIQRSFKVTVNTKDMWCTLMLGYDKWNCYVDKYKVRCDKTYYETNIDCIAKESTIRRY